MINLVIGVVPRPSRTTHATSDGVGSCGTKLLNGFNGNTSGRPAYSFPSGSPPTHQNATHAASLICFLRERVRQQAVGSLLKPSGSFWQREYWDVFMRSEEQEKTAIRYVENNPVKAKLCRAAEDWPFSSARLRDQYRSLVLPAKA